MPTPSVAITTFGRRGATTPARAARGRPALGAALWCLPLALAGGLALASTAAADTATPVVVTVSGQPSASVTLRPADAAGGPVTGPGYFVVDAAPGASVDLHALVSDPGTDPATASVVPVDASTSASGGISYGLPEQPRRSVGAWVSVAAPTVALQPGKGQVVSFRVTVPADAAPGQHVGGLSAFIAVPEATGGQQFGLRVQTRAVTAIQVDVPGPKRSDFAIGGVTVEQRPDAAYVVVEIRNSGNQLLKGQGTLTVTRSSDAHVMLSGPLTVDTTVPGTAAHYPTLWMRAPPPGVYHGHAELAWQGGSTVGDSDFTVAAATTARAQSTSAVFRDTATASEAAAPTSATDVAPSGLPLVPLLGVGGLVLVGLCGGIGLVVRRRRGR